jgi:hypothetical protein
MTSHSSISARFVIYQTLSLFEKYLKVNLSFVVAATKQLELSMLKVTYIN